MSRADHCFDFLGISPHSAPAAMRKSYRKAQRSFQPLLKTENSMRRMSEACHALLQHPKRRHKHAH